MTVNYQLVRTVVFPQPPEHAQAIRRRYVTLVALNVAIGQALMLAVRALIGFSVPSAKAIVETLLFLPNFLLQRDVVFRPPPVRAASTVLAVHEADVRSMPADAVFSVGLVEHFEPAVTRAVLRTHVAMARSGGTVLVSYPTPTRLYRAARRLLEYLHLWSFPDERPLRFAEVADALGDLGTIVARRTLWPLILTQELVVFRKR